MSKGGYRRRSHAFWPIRASTATFMLQDRSLALVVTPEHAASDEARSEGLFRASEEERERRHRLKEALAAEGFKWEPWQKPERGMVFGMIRQHECGEMQTHVRYYKDGVLKAEHEIAHHFLEHLISPRTSAHDEVEAILEKHGIDDVEVLEKQFPDRMKGDMPASRTPWKPVVMAAGAVVFGAIFGGKAIFGRD